MTYFSPCPLCGREAKLSEMPNVTKVDCEQCGHFGVTGSVKDTLANICPRAKKKIGFWTRDQSDLGDLPMVGSYTFEDVKKLPEKTVLERAERLLRFGIAEQKDIGGVFALPCAKAAGVTHSQSDADVLVLADFLSGQGWLTRNADTGRAQITPHGFLHASETNVTDSINGFIAMWFDPSMNLARSDGLELAIRNAGYNPIIVSGVEHINKIDDEIVSQIRKSKFLVADFTGHRGGVYFEAGFAMGLGLPVFWTCRKGDFDKLHFDIRQYNCIDWIDPADLATRLKRRIEAIIGAGPIRV